MITHTKQPRSQIQKFRFRVLIIGRANAGKTSILQRVCETTEGPVFFRIFRGKERVKLDPSMDRSEHTIDDELMFSNHKGYIFHDSRGVEAGSTEELRILQGFIQRKCGERRLRDRLHAIWYCVPMDNHRPRLDLKFFKDICPDKNVPVIAVFTKYDQFRRNVKIDLQDYGSPDDSILNVAENLFKEHYLHPLGGDVRFVRLEQMHRPNRRCYELIEKTAAALSGDIVALMLLAVQRGNLELSVKMALNRVRAGIETEHIVRQCLVPFPHIWLPRRAQLEEELEDLELEFDPLELDLLLDEELLEELLLDPLLRLELEEELGLRRDVLELLDERFAIQVMSLPTIQNLTVTNLGGYHLILAVILILKHASSLRLLNMSPESALTYAELDYRVANIDIKIQQLLTGTSQEHSVDFLASFIMATDIKTDTSLVAKQVA